MSLKWISGQDTVDVSGDVGDGSQGVDIVYQKELQDVTLREVNEGGIVEEQSHVHLDPVNQVITKSQTTNLQVTEKDSSNINSGII